jgi:hypothetical protein
MVDLDGGHRLGVAGRAVTCCVATAGLLVTDSRDQDETKRDGPKHFRVHDYVVGLAGDCAALMAAQYVHPWPKRPTLRSLTRWLFRYHDDARSNFRETSMLVVTRAKVYVMYGQYVYERTPAAIGSGGPYALGFLRASPDDLEGAVAAACYWDPSCAGPVRRIEV